MPRDRIIRKPTLFSRIKAYPFDLLLSINERRELIDWDSHAVSFALPLGHLLTFVFFVCCFVQGIQSKGSTSDFFDYDDFDRVLGNHDNSKKSSVLDNITGGLLMLLWSLCLLNCFLFLSKSRTYHIYNKDLNDKSGSASLNKVERSRSFLENIQEYFNMVRSESTVDEYWELRVWDPSKFSTYLFISFSPLNLIYLRSNTPSTITNFLLSLLNSFLLHYLIIFKFTQQAKDKKTLYEETMNEYQSKFVNPRLSTIRRSVGIDATKGPYSGEFVVTEMPGKYAKVFKTHDFKGRQITEVYNDELDQFEIQQDPTYKGNNSRPRRMLSPVKGTGFNHF